MKKIESHPARSIGFLSRLCDGELSMAERAEFDLHRRGCPECAAAAEEFEQVLALYRSAEPAPVDPSLAARITRRIDRELRRPEPARYVPVKIDLVWASVVIVALAGAIVTYSLVKPPSRRQETVIAEKKAVPPALAFAPQAPPEESSNEPSPAPRGQRGAERRAAAGAITKPAAPQAPAQPPAAASESDALAGRLDNERSRKAGAAGKTETAAHNAAAGAAAPAPPAEQQPAPTVAMAAPAPALEKAAPAPGMMARKEAKQAGEDQPIQIGPGVTPPENLKHVEPDISRLDQTRWKHPGIIIVEAVIDTQGNVKNPRFVREAPPKPLGDAILGALRQWKYKPAMKDGKPVAVYLTVTFNIALR